MFHDRRCPRCCWNWSRLSRLRQQLQVAVTTHQRDAYVDRIVHPRQLGMLLRRGSRNNSTRNGASGVCWRCGSNDSKYTPALDGWRVASSPWLTVAGRRPRLKNFKEPSDGVMVRTPRLDGWWRLGPDVAMGSFCWLRFHPFLFGKKGVVRRPHRVMCWHETWVCLHTTDWCWTRPGKKPAKAATNWSSHKLEQPFNCMAKATDATAGSLLAPTHSCPLLMIANISTVLYNQWM